MTSSASLRRRFGERQVGHAGTLDPDATGVLVVGVGTATRLLRFVDRLAQAVHRRSRAGHRDVDARRGGRGHRRVHDMAGRRRRRPAGRRRAPDRRHPAGAADGVGAQGRTGGGCTSWRARASRSSARRVRSRCSGSTSSEGRRPACCASMSSVRRARTSARSPPSSAACSAAGRTCAICAGSRSGAFTIDEAAPPDDCVLLPVAAAVRSLAPVTVDDEVAALVAQRTGARRRGRGTDRGRCSTTHETLLAVYEPFREREAKPSVVLPTARRLPGSVAVVRVVTDLTEAAWPGERSVITIGAYDGVHLGHQAVIRHVRQVARRPMRRTSVVRHIRPSPGDDRAAGIGAAAADRPRAAASSCSSRRASMPPSSCTFDQRQSEEPPSDFVERVFVNGLGDDGDRGRRGLPLRPQSRGQRRAAARARASLRLRRRCRSSWSSATTASTSR